MRFYRHKVRFAAHEDSLPWADTGNVAMVADQIAWIEANATDRWVRPHRAKKVWFGTFVFTFLFQSKADATLFKLFHGGV